MQKVAVENAPESGRLLDQIFAIPLGDHRFLIFAPLKQIAFVANPSLINLIVDRCQQDVSQPVLPAKPSAPNELEFLDRLDFFTPAPPPADPWGGTGVRYDAVVLFLTNEWSAPPRVDWVRPRI
jgi:hypothetical protein